MTLPHSPKLGAPLREFCDVWHASLASELRRAGHIYALTSFERSDIMHAAEEFAAVMYCTEGAPLDTRLHLRTFFDLLRERLKTQSVADALEAIDYSDTAIEQGHWQRDAEAEARHTLALRADWRHSRGVR